MIKYYILGGAIFFCSMLNAQIAKKVALEADSIPSKKVTAIENSEVEPSNMKRLDLGSIIEPELVRHSWKTEQGNTPKWYIFEYENDDFYWQNVDTTILILQLHLGRDVREPSISSILKRYRLLEPSSTSMHREMQNFFAYRNCELSREEIIELGGLLSELNFVDFIEPAPIMSLQLCPPNDTYWGSQWGPYAIYADSVYCYFTGGTNQLVGVIDNAFDWAHPDLYNTAWYGYDFVYLDNDPSPESAYSTYEHGTHVAGTVGAEIHNNVGIAGMLNDTLYVAKIADNTGSLDAIATLDAINTIASINRIRTYNMSFGGAAQSASQETAINNTWNAGKLPIAAAGNDAVNTLMYPAAYQNVVCVSALGVDGGGNYAGGSYSNYGNWIDVCAPGGETSTGYGIYSTAPGSNYMSMQGTSMASPHATGVAALIFATNPLLTSSQARSILESQVFDLGAVGFDQTYGNGVVCAICAFLEACNQFSISISSNGTSLCPGATKTLTGPNNDNLVYQWRKNGVDIPGANSYQYVANQSGNYTLFVQSLGGCQVSSNNITLSTVPNPTSSFNYGISGYTVNTTNNSSNGSSYSWTFGDGGTSSSFSPSHAYSSPGTYNITLTVINSCGVSSTSSQTITIVSSAALESLIGSDGSISVFPVPNDGNFNISYVGPDDLELDVRNSIGQNVMRSLLVHPGDNEYSIKKLAPGVYYLVFRRNQLEVSYRIIVN